MATPISYQIDKAQNIILETWTGTVKAGDLRDYWVEYLEDPEVMCCRRTLVDLRACTMELSGMDLMVLIDSVVVPKLNGRDWQTAIVVASPTQYGVSRQYSAFADLYSRDQIFNDPEEAKAWLLQQQNEVP